MLACTLTYSSSYALGRSRRRYMIIKSCSVAINIEDNIIILHAHLINLTVIVQLQVISLSLKVVEEAPIGHIWHHYGNTGASIETYPNQGHDVRMVKVLHLVHLTHHALNIRQREQTCRQGRQ